MKDRAGYEITGADATSLAAFEQAAHELRCFIGDPLATVARAIEHSPTMVMGHVLKAYLNLLGTEPTGLPEATAALRSARVLPANARERMHRAAAGHLVQGRWRAAGRVLEDLSIEYPHDALALQAGHQIDFFTGDSRMLRDRIARVVRAWSPDVSGYHAVLGMYAFGLEETGDYARAEAYGRMSVELEPRDGWGWHAVAHVMEMQERRRDGIAWMRANPEAWSRESFFAVHNWWHLALFHLGLDEVDEALRLFDGPIYGRHSGVMLEMIDASALLWRLHLHGVEVGHRWGALADRWAPVAGAGNYAFNDMHAIMAFLATGRDAEARAVLAAQEAALARDDDNATFTREVGRNATHAIRAFWEGDYASAVDLLRPIRSHAHRFGGSHAQRDLLDLTLIEAARRAGQTTLAHALEAERHEAKHRPQPASLHRPAPTAAMA
jgi:hypothetical protein